MVVLETGVERKRVGDTDIGEELKLQIKDLEMLLVHIEKDLLKSRGKAIGAFYT